MAVTIVGIVAGIYGGSENAVEHTWKIVDDLLVADPEDVVAKLDHKFIPKLVLVHLIIVNVPIDFDDELTRGAEEIEDEGAHRVLPPESEAGEPATAQSLPEQRFGWCGMSSEVSCVRLDAG